MLGFIKFSLSSVFVTFSYMNSYIVHGLLNINGDPENFEGKFRAFLWFLDRPHLSVVLPRSSPFHFQSHTFLYGAFCLAPSFSSLLQIHNPIIKALGIHVFLEFTFFFLER